MARLLIMCLSLVFTAGVSALPAPAQTGPQPGASQAAGPDVQATVSTQPEVLLSLIEGDEKPTVWRPFRLQFSILAGSLPSGIGVSSLKLSVPRAAGLTVYCKDLQSDGTVNLLTEALQLRTQGERREFAPIELSREPLTELKTRLLSVLTYRPRKEVFVATMVYEGLADRRVGTKTTKLVVSMSPHPLGMYAGAVLGSLLAALFLVLYRSEPPSGSDRTGSGSTWKTTHPVFYKFMLRFLRGTVATAIAVLVFQTTSDLALPISIAVQDFYGGVILGLFGDQVGDAISAWLAKRRPSQAAATTAGAP